jgi:hypothetical protein
MIAHGQYATSVVQNSLVIEFDGGLGTITLTGITEFSATWFV